MEQPSQTTPTTADAVAKLALEDGTVFTGVSIGAAGEVDGEVCFNTSMTGYQEILTDPSYRGQIVTMTYPQIGNYGVNAEDVESHRPHLAGFIVREHSRTQEQFSLREASLSEIIYVSGAISWRSNRLIPARWCGGIRSKGAMRGILSTLPTSTTKVWSPRRRRARGLSAATWCEK